MKNLKKVLSIGVVACAVVGAVTYVVSRVKAMDDYDIDDFDDVFDDDLLDDDDFDNVFDGNDFCETE
jgi:hypothetical protein